MVGAVKKTIIFLTPPVNKRLTLGDAVAPESCSRGSRLQCGAWCSQKVHETRTSPPGAIPLEVGIATKVGRTPYLGIASTLPCHRDFVLASDPKSIYGGGGGGRASSKPCQQLNGRAGRHHPTQLEFREMLNLLILRGSISVGAYRR